MDINTLKKRGFQALGEQLWKDADDIFSNILAQNPDDAECYLGKLMAEFHISTRKDLNNSNHGPIPESNKNYMEACRLSPQIAQELKNANATIEKTNQKNNLYDKAKSIYDHAESVEDYQKAAEIFKSIGEKGRYSDCIKKIEYWHIRWDAGPLEEKDINYATMGCKISEEDTAKILEAYKNSEKVIERFYYYKDPSTRKVIRASWIAKLFGAKDKVVEAVKLKEPIGDITMMEESERYKLNWYEAMAYVLILNRNNFAGFSDWRLPSLDELEQLCKSNKKERYVSGSDIRVWSSSTRSDSTDKACFMYFGNFYSSGVNDYYKSDIYSVRCVR